MRLDKLRQRLRDLGAKPLHENRLLRAWSHATPLEQSHYAIDDFYPLSLRRALPQLQAEFDALARLKSEHPEGEGVGRLLIELGDGQMIESVLLPRGGLCVSSQVGCAVGCRFCMSGRDGLLRQLDSVEIVAQVALARARREVSKVVFMGMGEPAHNLDNVLEAIDLLGFQGAIGHKNLVLSTVGDPRVFERVPLGRVKPALAISLHTTDAQMRAELLPHAPRIPIEVLVEQAEAYARASGHPIQYQWTLLDGINDSDEELEGIVRLLRGKYAIMNLIPFNRVDGLDYQRPSHERALQMMRALHQRGILTKLRNSAGQEVDGGCGQLRARAMRLARPA